MQYMPTVDMIVPVECDEFKQVAAPLEQAPPPAQSTKEAAPVESPEEQAALAKSPETSPAPVAPEPARELEGANRLKADVAELTGALNSAVADNGFRDSFCTLYAASQMMRKRKKQSEIKALQDQHAAIEKDVGEHGRLVYTALQDKTMDLVLGTPVDDALPSTRLRQTIEGQAFLKARSGLHLSCNCMYETSAPKHLVCCDSCDQKALEAKAAKQ